MTYYPYQKIRTSASIRDANGPADPVTMSLTITKHHAGVTETIATKNISQLTNPSVGEYYYDYTPGAEGAGTYFFNWVSADPDTEDEQSVDVELPHR